VGELKRKDFIVSDESVNSYGLVVQSSGVIFAKHVPAFYEHDLSTDPLGHWENMRMKGGDWMATLVYGGNQSEWAKGIYELIDSGHAAQASLGIDLKPKNTELSVDGKVVVRSLVIEISVVKIASNKNAIALYDGSLKKTVAKINLNAYLNPCKMLKAKELLNLSANATEEEVAKAIEMLQKKSSDVSTELLTLKANQQKNSIKVVLDASGVTGDERTQFEKLMELDFDTAEKLLKTRKPTLRLSSIPAINSTDSKKVTHNGMTWLELQKQNPSALLRLKSDNLELFKLMYQSDMGTEWKS
jgi:hypothetical protein